MQEGMYVNPTSCVLKTRDMFTIAASGSKGVGGSIGFMASSIQWKPQPMTKVHKANNKSHERPRAVRGSPPPPHPRDTDFRMKLTEGNIDLGHCWHIHFSSAQRYPLLQRYRALILEMG